MTESMIQLGKTGITISAFGLGTLQWGDVYFTDQPGSNKDHDIRGFYEVNMAAGINFFDTAEMYGNGKSERYFGKYL